MEKKGDLGLANKSIYQARLMSWVQPREPNMEKRELTPASCLLASVAAIASLSMRVPSGFHRCYSIFEHACTLLTFCPCMFIGSGPVYSCIWLNRQTAPWEALTVLLSTGETEAQIVSVIYPRIHSWNNRVRTHIGLMPEPEPLLTLYCLGKYHSFFLLKDFPTAQGHTDPVF